MRVLLITKESWNDIMYGNNVLTNWFGDNLGGRAEIAHIYCKAGGPYNKCCNKYFQITDSMVVKSYYTKQKAGKEILFENQENSNIEAFDEKKYKKLKRITIDLVRVIRDAVWAHAKYNEEGIKKFVEDFNPDIVFCPRLSSRGLLKVESIVAKFTKAPFVAFTGDNEYSYKLIRFSLFWYLNRMQTRHALKYLAQNTYKHYYTLSDLQAEEYNREFGIPTSTLYKGGDFLVNKIHQTVNRPIKIVYIGKFYCGRWKTLALLAKCLKKINKQKQKIILEIYTKDDVSKEQNKLLNDGENSFIMGGVSPDKIQEVYDHADIALHVEGLDLRNKLLTKYSFSTKITDCMSSGCAVMVISWNQHSGYQYLSRNDIAFSMYDEKSILEGLQLIAENSNVVLEYANKVYEYGVRNHQLQNIREKLYRDFERIIKESKQ